MAAKKKLSQRRSPAPAQAGHEGAGIMRNTQQLRAIFAAFASEDRPLSPGEAHALATLEVPGMGLATVYRLIKKLQAENQLVAVGLPSQPPRYEVAGKPHHHHFLCVRCDRTFELKACRANFDGLVPQGFAVHTHEVFLQGTCADCAVPKMPQMSAC